MSSSEKTASSIRLLLTNGLGNEVAIPFNDNLDIQSGMQLTAWLSSVNGRLGKADWNEDLKEDKRISTLGANRGPEGLIVTLGIREIFGRVAEAQKTGEILVDLSAESGFDALIRKVATPAKMPALRKR